MNRFDRIYLDTNIFIALVEWNNSISQMLVDMICAQPIDAPPAFCTSELTLAEALVQPAARKDEKLMGRYEATVLNSHWLEVVPVDRDILYYSAIARSKFARLKLPDAIHLSSAFAMGCSHFLTNDGDFKDSYKLTHEREQFAVQTSPVSIIRPDEATLSLLISSFAQ
jgi:predicted nucleic acid-binding protein